jgi:hypothetical protein
VCLAHTDIKWLDKTNPIEYNKDERGKKMSTTKVEHCRICKQSTRQTLAPVLLNGVADTWTCTRCGWNHTPVDVYAANKRIKAEIEKKSATAFCKGCKKDTAWSPGMAIKNQDLHLDERRTMPQCKKADANIFPVMKCQECGRSVSMLSSEKSK